MNVTILSPDPGPDRDPDPETEHAAGEQHEFIGPEDVAGHEVIELLLEGHAGYILGVERQWQRVW